METKKGQVSYSYFDKATGFLVRLRTPLNQGGLNFTMEVDLDDYKKVGDIVLYSTMAPILMAAVLAGL